MGDTGPALRPAYLEPIFLVPGGGSVYPHVEPLPGKGDSDGALGRWSSCPRLEAARLTGSYSYKADRIIALVQGTFNRIMDGVPEGERAMIAAALTHVALERNRRFNSPKANEVSEEQKDFIYDSIVDDKHSGKH